MNIYSNNKELLSTLGVEDNYSTDFEVRKAILNALGGDASMCNSIYEVDLQILKIYQEGGGGSTQKPVFKIENDCSFRTNETEIPFDIDSTGVTSFSGMFRSCSNLTTIPQLDTSKGTNFSYMFRSCSNLPTISQLDTSNGTDFSYMFNYCWNLTEIPRLDTSKGTNFDSMFSNCDELTTISLLDFSKGTNIRNTFDRAYKLKNITVIGSINYSISFVNSSSLSYESVKSILTACSNTTRPTSSKTVTFNRTLTDQNGELANLISTCNSKGWTVSGLTLE